MKSFHTFLLLFGLIGIAQAQKQTNDKFKEIYNNSTLAGFAVTLIKDGKVAYQKEFGFADIDKKKPYTSKTYQPLGSLSKQVIGIATLKAIELGYFELETEINAILPFKVQNPNAPKKDIKIKHLLTHTSGIVDTDDFYSSCYFIEESNTGGSNETTKYLKDSLGFQIGKMPHLGNLLKSYLSEKGESFSKNNFLNSNAGSTYEYSNIASSLMAYLIECVAKIPFSDFSKKYLFEPLKMNHTSWNGAHLDLTTRAKLYLNRNTVLPKYGLASYPDGALNTTNEDFAKFLREVLNGVSGNSTLLSKSSYELLQKDILGYIPYKQPKNRHISFFWYWNKSGRNTLYGSDPGLMTMMVIDVNNNSGYFLLQNMDYDNSSFQDEIEATFNQISSEMKKLEFNQ